MKKVVLLSASVISFSLINALLKPLSTKLDEIANIILNIDTNPKSAGVSNRANMIPTTNIENRVPILDVRVHKNPEKERSIKREACLIGLVYSFI